MSNKDGARVWSRSASQHAVRNASTFFLVLARELEAKLKALTPRDWGQSIDDCIRRVNVLLRGLLGYLRFAMKVIGPRSVESMAHLRRRLRAMILKQWKRKR